MADTPAAAPAAPAAGATPDPKDPAPPAATPAEVRKFKLKLDGQEHELPEDEVIKLAQLGKGANKRFEEAASMRKQAEQFLSMLRNPATLKQVLTDPRIGIDLKKFAEEYVWDQIQEQQLTPEQKKQRDVQRELDKYKDDEKKSKAEKETREAQELHQKYAADYDKRISTALQAANLPKTPATVARMANYMIQAVKNGYELEPADLVEQVRKDYIEDVKALFGQTDGDALLGLLGEDVAKKIRDGDMKRLKSTQGSQFSTPAPKPIGSGKAQEKPKKLDGKAWLKMVREDAKGRR